MSVVNTLLGHVVLGVVAPFRSLPAIVGLGAVSLLTAVAMLLVFRATSNQPRISTVKRAIHASLFEMRLFSDDLRAMFRAQLELLRHNLVYVGLSLVPMLWMLGPILLLIAQLQFYYGYSGLEPGQSAIVKVQLRDGASIDGSQASLEAPSGIRIETPSLWIPTLREVAWRIMPERVGDYELSVKLGDRTLTKSVQVSDGLGRRSPVRLVNTFLNQLLYPAEAPIDSGSPVSSISVSYPERSIAFFGWPLHWMVVYFVLSMLFAFALRGPFKVVI
jgi:hypothetical protein